MEMIVKFSQPFQKLTGRSRYHLECNSVMTVSDLLQVLAARFPALERYSGFQRDDSLSAHAMFVRSGRILLLSDRLDRKDQIEVFLPVTGG
jgi:sulfur carrier protein ThiS